MLWLHIPVHLVSTTWLHFTRHAFITCAGHGVCYLHSGDESNAVKAIHPISLFMYHACKPARFDHRAEHSQPRTPNNATKKISLKNLTYSKVEQLEEHFLLLCMKPACYALNAQSSKEPAKRPEFVATSFYVYAIDRLTRLCGFFVPICNNCWRQMSAQLCTFKKRHWGCPWLICACSCTLIWRPVWKRLLPAIKNA